MKNFSYLAAFLLALVVLSNECAIAAPSKKQQDYDDWLLSNQPFDKVPLVLDEMRKHGTATPARYQKLLAEWKAKKPEWDRQQAANRAKDLAFRKKKERERARALAALTPAQRFDLEMREKELNLRREQMAQQTEQQKQARREAMLNAMAGVMSQAANQIRADQRRQEDFGRALILQRMRNLNPRTYDSTVTPTYPGGPVHVHTEETGGY